MIRKGANVIVNKNHDKKSKGKKVFKGKVYGVYDRFFVIECEKGYKESFLKCDIDSGMLTVNLSSRNTEIDILNQILTG